MQIRDCSLQSHIQHICICLKHTKMKAIVTGVSRGIGKSLIQQFLGRGISCIGITRSRDNLSPTFLENENFQYIEWRDLSTEALVIENLRLLSNVDILINNAADILVKPVIETEDEDLSSLYQTNLIAPYSLIRHMYRHGLFNSGAHIINISSMGGFQGAAKFPGLSAYSISKAALVAMTESMAIELSDVSVNCLCLGAVQTEMLSKAFPNYKSEISDAQMAEFIINFATTDSKLMSGCIIPVKKLDPK